MRMIDTIKNTGVSIRQKVCNAANKKLTEVKEDWAPADKLTEQ